MINWAKQNQRFGMCMCGVPEVEGGVRVDCLKMRPWVALCRGDGRKEKPLLRAGFLAGWVSPSSPSPCSCPSPTTSSSGTWVSADRCTWGKERTSLTKPQHYWQEAGGLAEEILFANLEILLFFSGLFHHSQRQATLPLVSLRCKQTSECSPESFGEHCLE